MRFTKTYGSDALEPVSVEELRFHTHALEGTDEDAYLGETIAAAREYAENYTGRTLRSATITVYTDLSGKSVTLPTLPVNSITSVKYRASDGTWKTVNSADIVTDAEKGVVTIYDDMADICRDRGEPIEVIYTAGYTPLAVPKALKEGVKLLAGYWYNNRETAVVGSIAVTELPMASRNIFNMYKMWWW